MINGYVIKFPEGLSNLFLISKLKNRKIWKLTFHSIGLYESHLIFIKNKL